MLKSGIAGSDGSSISHHFKEAPHCFPQWLYTFTFPGPYLTDLVTHFKRWWTGDAAAAAKSLQSCPTLRPHRRQPTRHPRPWDSPGKDTGGGCHFLLQCIKVKSESEVAQSCPTLCDPMDCSVPGSSLHGILRARVLEWVAIFLLQGILSFTSILPLSVSSSLHLSFSGSYILKSSLYLQRP